MQTENSIRRYFIVGERRFSNYWWATVIFIGSLGFFFTGISSYFQTVPENLLEQTSVLQNGSADQGLHFFPQGLLMCFYGSLGFFLSLYWWCLIFWNVGGGFNEFNKKTGTVKIFRKGFPWKETSIEIIYPINDILRK